MTLKHLEKPCGTDIVISYGSHDDIWKHAGSKNIKLDQVGTAREDQSPHSAIHFESSVTHEEGFHALFAFLTVGTLTILLHKEAMCKF